MSETITLTFGDAGENHAGMKMVGNIGKIGSGFNLKDLLNIKTYYESNGNTCEIIHLNKLCSFKLVMHELKFGEVTGDAYILIIRKAVSETKEMFKEMNRFEWDKKYWDTRRQKVLNKHARSNVCFGDKEVEPDYENKQGRIVAYDSVPTLDKFKKELEMLIGEKANNLVCEGNRYFDIKKCGIGWHGDSERKKVIGIRLGQTMLFKIRWYNKSNPVSESVSINLNDGDMYIMSEKAVGYDWKRRNIFTLRHSAGCNKYTKEN